MTSNRRFFIQALLACTTGLGFIFKPLIALSAWNKHAFSANTADTALSKYFPDRHITPSNAIKIKVYAVVENGAVVPVEITTELPAAESITVLVEKNPTPLIAHFDLGPQCSSYIATRIKVAEPSDIIAVVQSEGKLYSARQFVKVIEGGCK